MVYLLLINDANPWSSNDIDYKSLCKNFVKITYFISKFRIRDMAQYFFNKQERQEYKNTFMQKFMKTKFKDLKVY